MNLHHIAISGRRLGCWALITLGEGGTQYGYGPSKNTLFTFIYSFIYVRDWEKFFDLKIPIFVPIFPWFKKISSIFGLFLCFNQFHIFRINMFPKDKNNLFWHFATTPIRIELILGDEYNFSAQCNCRGATFTPPRHWVTDPPPPGNLDSIWNRRSSLEAAIKTSLAGPPRPRKPT